MKTFAYRITAQAPLLMTVKSGDMNTVGTTPCIPGSVTLGVLAQRFIAAEQLAKASAHENKSFFQCFLSGKIRISNAYIFSDDRNQTSYTHFPVPLSIRREKENRNRIYDLLYEDYDEQTTPFENSTFCLLQEQNIQTLRVQTGLNFHHARNRQKGIPEQNQLFSYEAIAAGQRFEGTISGEDELLKPLLAACGGCWTGHIGRSKNAEYGRITFEILEEDTSSSLEREAWETSSQVALTLLSDTILYNDQGYATTDLKVLQEYLGTPILNAFLKKGRAEGFVGIWRLKTPSEACLKAGSSFLLDLAGADRQRLRQIEAEGLGERSHEGYGQCVLGWQHTTQEEGEDEEDEEENPSFSIISESKEEENTLFQARRPEMPIPDITRNALKTVIRHALLAKIELEALQEEKSFKRYEKFLPSRSLIGRLTALIRQQPRAGVLQSLGKLRKPARDQLERCRNSKTTLWNVLHDTQPRVQALLEKSSEEYLSALCEEIGYQTGDMTELEEEMFSRYFEIFFAAMRKHATR